MPHRKEGAGGRHSGGTVTADISLGKGRAGLGRDGRAASAGTLRQAQKCHDSGEMRFTGNTVASNPSSRSERQRSTMQGHLAQSPYDPTQRRPWVLRQSLVASHNDEAIKPETPHRAYLPQKPGLSFPCLFIYLSVWRYGGQKQLPGVGSLLLPQYILGAKFRLSGLSWLSHSAGPLCFSHSCIPFSPLFVLSLW